MANEIDVKRLEKITAEMIKAISSPQFVEAMRKLKATPMDKRLAEAKRTLTPSALNAAGAKLPPKMRISSRYFEKGSPPMIVLADDLATKFSDVVDLEIPTLNGAWACACGGAATACAGAGGGS